MRLRIGSKLSLFVDKDIYEPYMVYDISLTHYHLVYIADTYLKAPRFVKIERERFRSYCKNIKVDDTSLVEKDCVLKSFP